MGLGGGGGGRRALASTDEGGNWESEVGRDLDGS